MVNKVGIPDADSGLPEGLVGPPSIEPIKVNDLSCDALMDSGSTMEFPEDMAGVKGPVVVLALICPDPPYDYEAPVIVDINAFLFRRLFALSKESGSERKVHCMRIQAVYEQIETPTQPPQPKTVDEVLGQVKWQGLGPLSIAPGERCYVTCKVEQLTPMSKDIVLV
ncbi:uncharacterized protein LOC115786313 [Scomber scombrus]|uniref:Uncharacterized protein LOC115786313 n=1 Tax=Scomber scombrus TaxID=13677 RepID=A0AAV1PTN8_SCOSC